MKTSDFVIKTMNTNSKENSWRIIGPGGGGGQFIPAISPHNPDVMLVRCDMTGSYITHDGGKRWRQFNLRSVTEAFSFDPVNPDIIYAGACGLFRSEDRGETWKQIFPRPEDVVEECMVGDHAECFLVTDKGLHFGISAIAIDPEQTGSIYTGAVTASPEGQEKLCIFHSDNIGENWEMLFELKGERINKLYIHPGSSCENRRMLVFTNKAAYTAAADGTIVNEIALPGREQEIMDAACGLNSETGKVAIYLTTRAKWEGENLVTGVWKSTDEGQTWHMLRKGLDTSLAGPENGLSPLFNKLAVPENDARTVYLSVEKYPWVSDKKGNTINYFGVVKSEDEGESWNWVFKSDYQHNPDNLVCGWAERDYDMPWFGKGPKGFWPLTLGVSNVDPLICCYTDFSATFRTVDGGKTWEQLYSDEHKDGSVSTRGMDVTTCYGVHFDPFDKKHIAISYTDIGLFHSKDGGDTWFHSMNGITAEFGNTCYWLVYDPQVKGRVWSVWSNVHDLPRPKMFRDGKIGWYNGVVCRSDDGMSSWKVTSSGMDKNCAPTHIILDPSSPVGARTLYVAAFMKGVYKSTDDGKTWTLKNNGIGNNLQAWDITMLPDGTLYLVVARGAEGRKEIDGALYKSCDGAEHWEKLPLPEGVNAPNDIVFDPSNPKRMYLACWTRTINHRDYYGGVYSTDDGGCSWKNIFDQSRHVYGMAVDPANPSTVYLNTFDGLACRSDNKGESWKSLKGYDFKWGHRPVPDPHNKGMLYLTTFGSSVWYGSGKEI